MAGRSRRAGARERAQLSMLVLETLQFLKEHMGWSTRAVTYLIREVPKTWKLAVNAGCTKRSLGRRVAAVLRRGVRVGVVKRNGGRYRLGDSRPVVRRAPTSRHRKRLRSQLRH